MRFLVDTGATFSLIPASRSLLRSTPMLKLKAANGRSVNVFAPTQKRVSFEGLGNFSWDFRPADTEFYILGADFQTHFGPVEDVGRLSLFRRRSATAVSNLCLAVTIDPLAVDEVSPVPLAPSIMDATDEQEFVRNANSLIERRSEDDFIVPRRHARRHPSRRAFHCRGE